MQKLRNPQSMPNQKPFVMSGFKVFIVEDDSWYAEMLQHFLSLNPDLEVEVFSTGEDLLDNMFNNPAVVTLDYSLPGIQGVELLKKVLEKKPGIPVISLSGQEDVSTAVSMLKEGAYDYIVKDENTQGRLWKLISRLKDDAAAAEKAAPAAASTELGPEKFATPIIGDSPVIRKVLAMMEKAAKTNITVSITGETGTGKELAATTIHKNSTRRKEAFVAVNVSAIPSELMESELFGHEKGAFTGAANKRIGKFEEAHGGTIFLDEIGDMNLSMQAKLLRVLQEREVTPIGSNKVKRLDVRVIVATHKDLAEEVRNGNFREDLYYRLLGLPVVMPPLRDRESDIQFLAEKFIAAFCDKNGLDTPTLTKDATKKLSEYPFPGNVRELKALIELSAVMSNDGEITPADINFQSARTANGFLNEEKSLKDYTNEIIQHVLDKNDGNVMAAAKKLDIGKSTIYRMLQGEPEDVDNQF
ncbi:MAG: two-component system response regulator AtoC [Bacteroidia bacterium]